MITVSTAAPTATTETSQTVQEDGSTTISLTATDPNGQAVTFAITTDPSNGTATLSGTEITYTVNIKYKGLYIILGLFLGGVFKKLMDNIYNLEEILGTP